MKKIFPGQNKILLALALCSFCLVKPAFAQSIDGLFQKGVEEYRKGNSQECLLIMEKIEKKDPSNAYVEYYLAMSQAKLGNLDEAKEKYEKVILLNQDSQLVSYAKEGLNNIEKNQVNESSIKTKKESKLVDKPFFKAETDSKNPKNTVSDDEIAKAIKTLREAGLLNVQLGVNTTTSSPNTIDPNLLQQNSEMMQMNMLMSSMGGGSKNSSMDMLPFLMMQQQQNSNGGKSTISPEIIQMMMNNSMLDGMGSFDTNDKDK
jgi:tetratricopeptide (TPR) repeat protein